MNKTVKELIKYAFFGGLSTIINYGLFVIMVRCDIQYIISNVSSYIVAVILTYWFNERFVFEDQKKKRSIKIKQYILNRLLLIAVDSILLSVLTEILKIHVEISKVIVVVVLLLANYLISKFWIFK